MAFNRPTDHDKAQARSRAYQLMSDQRKLRKLESALKQQQQEIDLLRRALVDRTPRRTIAAGFTTAGQTTIIPAADFGKPRPGTIEERAGDYFPPDRRTPRNAGTFGSELMDVIEDWRNERAASRVERIAAQGA